MKKKQSKPAPTLEPRHMHVEGFVDDFERIHRTMQNRRFAFILGAGASKSSGIGTGGEFVRKWLEILYHRDNTRGQLSFEEWLNKTKAGISDLDPKNLAASYPQVYAVTFDRDPDAGYAYLEDAMKNAEPRYGYAVLAYILESTQHKVVVTVNFDNLVADSLSNYSDTFPLVCGHDSLAGFAQPNLRRPLILKIHHDLLLGPKSRPEELDNIGKGYREAIRRLLQHYTPIVIGYGGNDGSLMAVLESFPEKSIPGGIYWCYKQDESLPRLNIRNLVAKQNGWLIPISGFDEIMAMLGDRLKFNMPDEKIRQRAEKRANQLVEHAKELRERLKSPTPESKPGAAAKTAGEELKKTTESALKSLESTLQRTDGKRRWWQWVELANNEKDSAKAVHIYQLALAELPDSAPLVCAYANFLFWTQKDDGGAYEFYKRAFKIDPKNTFVLINYAIFLYQNRSLKDYDKAQELFEQVLKDNPKVSIFLWQYAVFLHRIRNDYDLAQNYFDRALTSNPNDANGLTNYANFLTEVRKEYKRAQELYERALKVDPNNVSSLVNYGTFLYQVCKRYESAVDFYERALKIDPDNAVTLGSYAFIKTVGKDYEQAQKYYELAFKADPNHANNLGNYTGLLLALGKNAEGLNNLDRVITLNPKQSDLEVEIWFYAYAHRPADRRNEALTQLRKLILEKVFRSPNWDFSKNIERAIQDGHPEAAWLPKLAAVINGKAEPTILADWPAWRNA